MSDLIIRLPEPRVCSLDPMHEMGVVAIDWYDGTYITICRDCIWKMMHLNAQPNGGYVDSDLPIIDTDTGDW